jgi:hypothetical protein
MVSAGDRITMLRGQERVVVDDPKVTGPPIKDLGFEKKEQQNEKAKGQGAVEPPATKLAHLLPIRLNRAS